LEKKRDNFIKLSDSFIKSDEVTAEEKFVYAIIKMNNPLGMSMVSVVGLLEQLNMSSSESRNKTKIKKIIERLDEMGYVEVYKDQAGLCKTDAIKPSTLYFFKCLDTADNEGYFTMFDVDIIKEFIKLDKREKFGVFAVYASIVAPIFEDDKNTKVSWVSQETIQFETGLSEKTVSKYIYLLKDELKIIDIRKMRFTPKKQIKGKKKVVSKSHNFYWRVEDAGLSVDIGISDAMEKLGYSSQTHYIQEIDRNNNPVEVQNDE
jgi:transcriptional regulator with PAS, ATPase and Fis domain